MSYKQKVTNCLLDILRDSIYVQRWNCAFTVNVVLCCITSLDGLGGLVTFVLQGPVVL